MPTRRASSLPWKKLLTNFDGTLPHSVGNIEAWEAEGKWLFVDASPQSEEIVMSGEFNLDPLLVRIEQAIAKIKAKRLVVDSLDALLSRSSDQFIVRRELNRIITAFSKRNVTAVITSEQADTAATYDVGAFVADNVIILRNTLEEQTRRRSIEILKFRGADHQKREFFFGISANKGIEIVPPFSSVIAAASTDVRTSTGNGKLDAMCAGGIFRDSITLVSGPSGTGKTLTATQFTGSGIANGERTLFVGYEENRQQLFRNAAGWGVDFERADKEGKLKVICKYPEEITPEEHLIRIKKAVHEFNPTRFAIDSLSALERISSIRSFREFIVGLTSLIRENQICALLTTTTESLVGGTSITEAHISTLADVIVLLRNVEVGGAMQRAVTILKMRGSDHDKSIRCFTIDHAGMHIGEPLSNVIGILSGNFRLVPSGEAQIPKAA